MTEIVVRSSEVARGRSVILSPGRLVAGVDGTNVENSFALNRAGDAPLAVAVVLSHGDSGDRSGSEPPSEEP